MAGYSLLDAVNFVLERSNETPVSSLTTDSSSASTLAKQFIEHERLFVLSEGLQFNTRNRDHAPDTGGFIQFGANVLSVDGYGDNSTNHYTLVENKLFDTDAQSDIFTEAIELEVVFDYSFEEIPRWVQYRIMTRVALSFMAQFSPDNNQLQDMADLARQALIRSNEKELLSKDVNMIAKSALGKVSTSGLYRRIGNR